MSWTVPNIRRGRSDSSFVTSPWLWMMRTSPFRADDPVLHVVALAAGECFRHRSHDPRPVFGMNELLISRDGYRAFVRRQAEDAVALLRPVDEPSADVTLPVAHTRDTLGLFQLALAFSQVGGPFQHFSVERVAGVSKFFLCPAARGGDPADDQCEHCANSQIDEIGVAKAEGIKRSYKEEIEAQDRKDDGEDAWPDPRIPNGCSDREQEWGQCRAKARQDESRAGCNRDRQNCNAVAQNRRNGFRR